MVLYHTLCVLLPCILCETILLWKRRGDHKSPLRRRKALLRHLAGVLLFSLYLNLVLMATGIGTAWDIGKFDHIISIDRINLLPFSDITKDGSFDYPNILLFVPMGVFLPSIWRTMRALRKTTFFAFLFSLCIEVCQLLNSRVTDITDLIYNTAGGFLGFLLWYGCFTLASPRRRRPLRLSRWEPLLITFLPLAGVFLLFNPRISFDHAFGSGESEKISVEYMTIPRPDEASLSFEKDWVMEHAALFPEGKAESAAENPELIHFMFMLGNGDTGSESTSLLTEEETSGEIPCLFQWDKRWGFYDYGENNVGFSGCGPTCLAMVLASYIGDPKLTPGFLSNYAMENGYYESGAGTRWAFMTEVAESCGVTAKQLRPSQIPDELSAGHPVIVSVGKGHFTEAGHFILLAGIEDGKIRVHDPNSLTNSETLWDFEIFQDEIKAGWGYRKE